jgi:uncharacterized membrane protein
MIKTQTIVFYNSNLMWLYDVTIIVMVLMVVIQLGRAGDIVLYV